MSDWSDYSTPDYDWFNAGNIGSNTTPDFGSFGPSNPANPSAKFDISKYMPAISNLIGGGFQFAQGQAKQEDAQRLMEQQRADWERNLQANRANQFTPFGSSEWTKDDKGNWTQTQKLSPELQERLNLYNEIAKGRLETAKGVKLSSGNLDLGLLGMGNIAKAAGLTNPQSESARPGGNMPIGQNPYDMGGGMLNQYYNRGFGGVWDPASGR